MLDWVKGKNWERGRRLMRDEEDEGRVARLSASVRAHSELE